MIFVEIKRNRNYNFLFYLLTEEDEVNKKSNKAKVEQSFEWNLNVLAYFFVVLMMFWFTVEMNVSSINYNTLLCFAR